MNSVAVLPQVARCQLPVVRSHPMLKLKNSDDLPIQLKTENFEPRTGKFTTETRRAQSITERRRVSISDCAISDFGNQGEAKPVNDRTCSKGRAEWSRSGRGRLEVGGVVRIRGESVRPPNSHSHPRPSCVAVTSFLSSSRGVYFSAGTAVE
jgi:hypothetical protein